MRRTSNGRSFIKHIEAITTNLPGRDREGKEMHVCVRACVYVCAGVGGGGGSVHVAALSRQSKESWGLEMVLCER